MLQSGSTLHRQLGTGSYMAPEILGGKLYTEKVDMWSAGVIFFVKAVFRLLRLYLIA